MRTLTYLIAAGMTLTAAAAMADEKLDKEGRAAMVAFTEAVIAGPKAVAAITAPEYQIMRSNGVGYDKDGYIATVDGVDIADYTYEDIVTTTAADIMVVRSMLAVNETIDGQAASRRAPRLTVFRKIDGEWKVVAHGNFALIGKEQ